ncbi:putative rhomboid family protein [Phaeomoniella chlamydospora]|uniref:Putative rhomboid family protein n=1 Tax=Phaeomoniella chlamydospora TaxID=158046 RepID=A0A0G2EGQ8_PHACM|nr:putative rhomboid family protein [Phaeomoniella chlamydospora]
MAPINIPPVTRILLIIIVALSFLYNIARWRQLGDAQPDQQPKILVPYLTLVPSQCLFYPWTFLTATFVEQNVFTLIVNGLAMFYGGKYLERAWGSKEFGIFVLIVAVVPNLIIMPVYVLWAAISGNVDRALTQICGGITTQAAFLCAFKQLVPEHTVSLFKGFVKVRVKHFPAVFLVLNAVSGLIAGTDTAAILSWVGLLTSWTYLRFYKRQPDLSGTSTGGEGLRGDASETFSFATFFPDAIQPPIAAVTDQVYNVLVSIGACTPFSAEDIASGNERAAARGEAGLPSLLNNVGRGRGKREEAERRRALALKALDQRLQAASTNRPATQPVAVSPAVQEGQSSLGGTDYQPDESNRT